MESRPFGSTGLHTTTLGLGLAALGRPAYINLGHAEDLPADRSVDGIRARAHEVLDHAWMLGIRYIDAARSYGLAERFLAGWLAEHPDRSAQVTIGSKWGYTYTADWRVDIEEHEVKDHSLATFTRQLAETRGKLGEGLNLYQIHSATLDTGVLEDDDVLAALRELAEAGVVVGLTVSGPEQGKTIERALEVAAAGQAPFQSVQATWNLLEPSVAPALQAAADAGWGIILKEVVANGRLAPRARAPGELLHIADQHGASVDAIAMAAAMAQPFRPVVLSGASARSHLDSNVTALDLKLSGEDLERLQSIAETPTRYWATRSDLAWT